MTSDETVRDVCVKMLDHANSCRAYDFEQCPTVVNFSRKIIAAHEREMAAKDAEIERLKEECNHTRLDAQGKFSKRIELLEHALNNSPEGVIYQLGLTDDDGNCYDGCAIKFDKESESEKMPPVAQGDRFIVVPSAAVNKFKCVMNEGENK